MLENHCYPSTGKVKGFNKKWAPNRQVIKKKKNSHRCTMSITKKMKFSNKEKQIKIRYYFTYKIDNYKKYYK